MVFEREVSFCFCLRRVKTVSHTKMMGASYHDFILEACWRNANDIFLFDLEEKSQ